MTPTKFLSDFELSVKYVFNLRLSLSLIQWTFSNMSWYHQTLLIFFFLNIFCCWQHQVFQGQVGNKIPASNFYRKYIVYPVISLCVSVTDHHIFPAYIDVLILYFLEKGKIQHGGQVWSQRERWHTIPNLLQHMQPWRFVNLCKSSSWNNSFHEFCFVTAMLWEITDMIIDQLKKQSLHH